MRGIFCRVGAVEEVRASGNGPWVWMLKECGGTMEPRHAVQARREMVRRMVARGLGVEGVEMEADGHGRPRVVRPAGSGVDVSIAHAGGWVAVGMVRGGRVGVDVEVVREVDTNAVAGLTAGERAFLGELKGEERVRAFYGVWTVKEALLKALGVGMTFGMEEIEMRWEGGEARVVSVRGSRRMAEGWRVAMEEMGGIVVAGVWDGRG